jgi:tetratricopeptide (TPR) repeat protein
MKTSTYTGVAALAAVMLGAGAAWAQIAGTIITTEGKALTGAIRWKVREKAYAITQNNIDIEMPLANVRDIQIPKPKELDAAVKNVQEGSAAQAIPVLEKISNDYLMLQWDKVATRLLADAYVKAGEADKAIRVCEKVIASNPEAAYLGEMAPAYWQALLKAGRASKAEDLVTKAIKSGDREASAFALITRGDLILASGETNEVTKKALRDGFLRVVTLYKAVKSAQPEALYKAAKCFDKLGQTARADQMRTALKSEFGASEWARKQ